MVLKVSEGMTDIRRVGGGEGDGQANRGAENMVRGSTACCCCCCGGGDEFEAIEAVGRAGVWGDERESGVYEKGGFFEDDFAGFEWACGD